VLDRDTLSVPVPRPSFAHEWVEHAHTGREQVAARVAGASIVVSNKVRIDEAALTAAPALRLIAIPATGTNNVELEACRRRGVTVCNVPSYGPQSVAEHVFALVLALRRNLLQYVAEVRAGRWERAPNFCFVDHPIADLAGSRLGVVGSGAIGSAVARIGAGFGMQVLQAERRGAAVVRPGYVAFDEVLESADVLSLHLPLTPQTHHLIGAGELARMRPGAVLINTARGPLVDEAALAAALREILDNMVRLELRLYRLHREFHLKYHPELQVGMRLGPYESSRQYVDEAWGPFVALYVPALDPVRGDMAAYMLAMGLRATIRVTLEDAPERVGEPAFLECLLAMALGALDPVLPP